MTTRIEQAAELVKTQTPHQLALRVVDLTQALQAAKGLMASGILSIDHVIWGAPRNHAVQSQIVEMAAEVGTAEQSALPLIDALQAAGFEWPEWAEWVAQDCDGEVFGYWPRNEPYLCVEGDGWRISLEGEYEMPDFLLDLPLATDWNTHAVSREEYEQHTGGNDDC